MSSNSQSKSSAVKPICKFCAGAGEPVEVYTSHWQFSKPTSGVLTCPKLLNYECKNCNSHGHIEKRCPTPKQVKEKKEKIEKFCRFCYNANKSEYNEHNQFDKDGFVQCPALLTIECQGCGERGHTKKYCPGPVLSVVTPANPTRHKKLVNKFASLSVEELEEEPKKEVDVLQAKNINLFPALSQASVILCGNANSSSLNCWSKVASNKEPAPQPPQVIANEEQTRPPPPTTPPPRLVHTIAKDLAEPECKPTVAWVPPTVSTSWADEYDD